MEGVEYTDTPIGWEATIGEIGLGYGDGGKMAVYAHLTPTGFRTPTGNRGSH